MRHIIHATFNYFTIHGNTVPIFAMDEGKQAEKRKNYLAVSFHEFILLRLFTQILHHLLPPLKPIPRPKMKQFALKLTRPILVRPVVNQEIASVQMLMVT